MVLRLSLLALALALISHTASTSWWDKGSANDNQTNYKLWCYRGLKYRPGQDPIEDNQECPSVPFFHYKYCYRFTIDPETVPYKMVKLGCSSAFCSGVRNSCANGTFPGLGQGELCCCNTHSYCNGAGAGIANGGVVAIFAVAAVLLIGVGVH